jgi:hypothetical protein
MLKRIFGPKGERTNDRRMQQITSLIMITGKDKVVPVLFLTEP